MKILPTFTNKVRYISQDMQLDTQKLLRRMQSEAVCKQTTNFFEISEIRGLKIRDAVFKDGKFLAKRDSEDKLTAYGKSKSMLEFDKIRLIIDNVSGKIIEHKKPFFKSWKSLLNQAHNIIIEGLNHYHDKNIVEKIMFKKNGLTQQGKTNAAKNIHKILETFDTLSNQIYKGV